ncbi:polyhydroxyalkanoic acid system family protein [Azospirillum sp.]|uniref:polyhydroxyalkanoic acid system family protein n=1 Tax=Azospirillum sp. TaxID=34012 RepID=UPI002D647558|nr:polyhydroxyalkanoic acid system family protein [Azospirillum sp.]HYD67726.1 polyhydroxyalkanoic acid system family protein [Azospirillum sp.]HYH20302.1 polyhydroxyalkanoic acid system family protein [Azospirillum sp.]
MSKPLTVTIPHQLGRQEAKDRIDRGLGQLRSQLSSLQANVEETWTEDRLDFRLSVLAQTVAGRIDVDEREVRVEVDLPWLLAKLGEKLTHRIREQGMLMLEKK